MEKPKLKTSKSIQSKGFSKKRLFILIFIISTLYFAFDLKIFKSKYACSPDQQNCIFQVNSLNNFLNFENSFTVVMPGDGGSTHNKFGYYQLFDMVNEKEICKIKLNITKTTWRNDTLYYSADSFDYNLDGQIILPRKVGQ